MGTPRPGCVSDILRPLRAATGQTTGSIARQGSIPSKSLQANLAGTARRLSFSTTLNPSKRLSTGMVTAPRAQFRVPPRFWGAVPFPRRFPDKLVQAVCEQLHPISDRKTLKSIAHTSQAGHQSATKVLFGAFQPRGTWDVEALMWGRRFEGVTVTLPSPSAHEAIRVLDLSRLDLTDFIMVIRRYHPAPRHRDDKITELVSYRPLFPNVTVFRFSAPQPPRSPFIHLGKSIAAVPLLHDHLEYGGFGQVQEICTELHALQNDVREPAAWRLFFANFLANQKRSHAKPTLHYHLDRRNTHQASSPNHLIFTTPGAHNRFYVTEKWIMKDWIETMLKLWIRTMLTILCEDSCTTWELIGLAERLSPFATPEQLVEASRRAEVVINNRLIKAAESADPPAGADVNPAKMKRWNQIHTKLKEGTMQRPIKVTLLSEALFCPACAGESWTFWKGCR